MKGATKIMHKTDLMEVDIHELQAASEALSKCRRTKKARLRKGGPLSIQEAQELGDQMEVEVHLREKTCNGAGRQTADRDMRGAVAIAEKLDTMHIPVR